MAGSADGRIRVLEVLEATEGGTRTHFRDLITRLDRDRFAVDVATNTGREPGFAADLARFRELGVAVHLGPLVRPPRPRADLAALAWLRRLIRDGRYDLVHGHSSKAGFLARLAAYREGVTGLYTPNAFRFQAPDAGPFERRAVITLERLAAGWGAGIICVSEGEREAALAARLTSPERLWVIPNGIDLGVLDAQAAQGGGRETLGAASDAPVVLTVGRRVPQKGDRYLLDAWPAVRAAHPTARLVLVGGGALEADLRAQAARLGIAETVRFRPTEPAVGRLYAAATVYVLPSLYEGCPYTLLEAMASGLPCVATAVAGSRDVLDDGRTGLLVPPADPAALAAALGRLLADADLRSRLGGAARQVAREHYRVETMVTATEDLYDRLVNRAAGRGAGP